MHMDAGACIVACKPTGPAGTFSTLIVPKNFRRKLSISVAQSACSILLFDTHNAEQAVYKPSLTPMVLNLLLFDPRSCIIFMYDFKIIF